MLITQADAYGSINMTRVEPVDHREAEEGVEDWLRRTHDLDLEATCPREVPPLAGSNFTCRAGDRRVRVQQIRGGVEFGYVLVDEDES